MRPTRHDNEHAREPTRSRPAGWGKHGLMSPWLRTSSFFAGLKASLQLGKPEPSSILRNSLINPLKVRWQFESHGELLPSNFPGIST